MSWILDHDQAQNVECTARRFIDKANTCSIGNMDTGIVKYERHECCRLRSTHALKESLPCRADLSGLCRLKLHRQSHLDRTSSKIALFAFSPRLCGDWQDPSKSWVRPAALVSYMTWSRWSLDNSQVLKVCYRGVGLQCPKYNTCRV